jgi:menaquinone-9 beta-reductase
MLQPIEIIGGGLAGLSLGIALRRENVPVTLHDAGTYPRHRVCGEFIAGLRPSTIERLGVADDLADALHHKEVAWTIGGGRSRVQRLPTPALGLSRHVLDARLARRFESLGGVLQSQSRIVDDENRPGRVFATGRRRSSEPRWIGLKTHARGLSLVRDLEMHLGENCYVGLARIAEGVNICGLFRRRALAARGPELLVEYVRAAGLTELAARLDAAHLDAESFCAVAALEFDQTGRHGDRLSVGDASAMIPPFTGNGMAMAFQSAELALYPLLRYVRGASDWTETCRATSFALRGRFRFRLAFAHALHSFLLQPRRQRWFAALSRARLLPFGPLYAALH